MKTRQLTGREQRRALARTEHTQQARSTQTKQRGRMDKTDQVANNKVAQATVRGRIERDVKALRTRAGLLAHLGDDTNTLCDAAGRLIYIVAHAATLHNQHNSPEAKIMLGTANALGDIAASPETLDAQRAAILSGLAACERLLPHLHTWSLCAGALELDQILNCRDFTTNDVFRALQHATDIPTAQKEQGAANECP